MSAACLVSLAAPALADSLRLPAPNSTGVPTNTSIWFTNATDVGLRDSAGAEVEVEYNAYVGRNQAVLQRLRPTADLAANATYTVTLRLSAESTETFSFTTGTQAQTRPPAFGGLTLDITTQKYESSIRGCPDWYGNVLSASSPSTDGTVLQVLEYSRDQTTFIVASYIVPSPGNRFFVFNPSAGWWRVRPISIAALSPTDSSIEALRVTPPALPDPGSCSGHEPPHWDDEDSAGCSAAGGSSPGALALGIALLLATGRRGGARRKLLTFCGLTIALLLLTALTYDLRDSRGNRIPVEHSTQRVNATGLHRIRPIVPLAPSTSYTVSLTFVLGPAEDEAGCSASDGPASSATLALLVTCVAGLRGARRRAGR